MVLARAFLPSRWVDAEQGPHRRLSGRQIMALMALVLAYLALAVLVAPDDARHLEFLERGLVTWLSGGLMGLTAAAALLCALVYPSGSFKGRLFWCLVSGAFAFFFVDEFFQLHERLGDVIDRSAVGIPEGIRSWNDVVVIAYGLGSLAALILFLREILRYPSLGKWLGIGFGFYVLHTAIESLVMVPSSWSIIPEESVKVFAVLFFFLAASSGLISLISNRVRSTSR